MRKIILNVAISLDGFIEDENGGFDWCFTDQDYGMTEFLRQIDAIFFGRKSFEVLQAFDEDSFSSYRRIVFSGKLDSVPSGWELGGHDASEYASTIKRQPGKDIWLFGGSKLLHSLMRKNLVDEYLLSVHPIALGSGTSLFGEYPERVKLKLISSQSFDSGLVQLRYKNQSG